MKVNGANDIRENAVLRRKKLSSAGSAFAVAEEPGESSAAQGNALAAPIASLNSLLTLQEVGEREEDSLERGHKTLDLLEEIRVGLLMGGIPASRLKVLTQMIREERGSVSDHRLAGILDEIDLRARVELAKYEMNAE